MSVVPSSLLRSEVMSLIQLYIPFEVAQGTVSELGELDLVHFRDMNANVNPFQRTFVNEIRRFDEVERNLRFIASQARKMDMVLVEPDTRYFPRSVKELDELERRVNDLASRLEEMNRSQENLEKRHLEMTELKHVLRDTANFFTEVTARQEDRMMGVHSDDHERPLLHQDIEEGKPERLTKSSGLGFVAGVIDRKKMITFERVLWRALRGNLYLNYSEIDEVMKDPNTGDVIEKNVFLIFAHGKEILNKIKKICESLGATLYSIDDSAEKRREHSLEVAARLEDLNSVIYNTNQTRRSVLSQVIEMIGEWTFVVRREKAIYHTMNMFNYDDSRRCLIAEGWAPKNKL
ncbi:hypothetical protein ROZALSC1DRAFT_13150, partial [Rozella allomycis CSF55]